VVVYDVTAMQSSSVTFVRNLFPITLFKRLLVKDRAERQLIKNRRSKRPNNENL